MSAALVRVRPVKVEVRWNKYEYSREGDIIVNVGSVNVIKPTGQRVKVSGEDGETETRLFELHVGMSPVITIDEGDFAKFERIASANEGSDYDL